MKNNMMEMTRKKDILREERRDTERGKKTRFI
jgi:hypothetical protein